MKVLIAEDNRISSRILQIRLTKWGYEVERASDGNDALEKLTSKDAPQIVILDWILPGIDGLEVCKRIRSLDGVQQPYIILMTGNATSENIVEGLNSGADDYLAKPFNDEELRARLHAGLRITQLQSALNQRIMDLEFAMSKVKELQGLLPICSYCKTIRDDSGYWHQVTQYVSKDDHIPLAHDICPNCHEMHLQPEIDSLATTRPSLLPT
jgi:sigma-B regulation protein RsbU (phosphoserine phosphatase)